MLVRVCNCFQCKCVAGVDIEAGGAYSWTTPDPR